MSWAVRALVSNELGTSRWDIPASPTSDATGEIVGPLCAVPAEFPQCVLY